ncbi:MAG TPA: serine/threonine-protein kinase [Fimbriiglobus sp.]
MPNPDPSSRRFAQACADLDKALRAGERFPTEEWVSESGPFGGDADSAVELIFTEFVTRETLGQAPTADEYYSRFPAYADRLRRLFGVDELLRDGIEDSARAAPKQKSVEKSAGIPEHIGKYELRELIGAGGAGVVYRGWDPTLRRDVAVKVLKSGESSSESERERFRREAEAVARLNHRNVVHLYEVGDHDGRPFLVMEYLPGGTLRTRFGGQSVSPFEAAAMVKTLARAAHHAHAKGIIHRDLKPANVLLEETRLDDRTSIMNRETVESILDNRSVVLTPKITDFGLAALLGPDDVPSAIGNLMGTASYMAPEQAEGRPGWVSPAVDVYALGAILYELLVGRPPFLGESPIDTLRSVVTEDPVPPRKLQPKLPRNLETICLRCLRKDPAKRYPSAAALADDLHQYLDGRPIEARPVGLIERTTKWVKKNPLVATAVCFGAACVLGLAVVGAGTVAKWW